ncbi:MULTISPECIES: hypothetical protein [unclassified Burkholderia]|uniref:hypothetical protein n=1 Tax=unclassified Burkholderia TaxID=2613784 RepID=UPI00211AF1DA|nr:MULTISPECIES: hypothetical protein [unclassified Burkholderia]
MSSTEPERLPFMISTSAIAGSPTATRCRVRPAEICRCAPTASSTVVLALANEAKVMKQMAIANAISVFFIVW